MVKILCGNLYWEKVDANNNAILFLEKNSQSLSRLRKNLSLISLALKDNRIKFITINMKCAFCKIHEAKYDPKPNWNVYDKICQECYDYLYIHDPKSLENRPAFRKLLKLSKKKWFIGLIASLFVFSILMRIFVQIW